LVHRFGEPTSFDRPLTFENVPILSGFEFVRPPSKASSIRVALIILAAGSVIVSGATTAPGASKRRTTKRPASTKAKATSAKTKTAGAASKVQGETTTPIETATEPGAPTETQTNISSLSPLQRGATLSPLVTNPQIIKKGVIAADIVPSGIDFIAYRGQFDAPFIGETDGICLGLGKTKTPDVAPCALLEGLAEKRERSNLKTNVLTPTVRVVHGFVPTSFGLVSVTAPLPTGNVSLPIVDFGDGVPAVLIMGTIATPTQPVLAFGTRADGTTTPIGWVNPDVEAISDGPALATGALATGGTWSTFEKTFSNYQAGELKTTVVGCVLVAGNKVSSKPFCGASSGGVAQFLGTVSKGQRRSGSTLFTIVVGQVPKTVVRAEVNVEGVIYPATIVQQPRYDTPTIIVEFPGSFETAVVGYDASGAVVGRA
jgi:hypothetical protein